MIKRRWRPSGLYWQLIASYFLVTLVAVLILEAATVLLPLIQDYQQFSTGPALDQQLETQQAPQIVPYLHQGSPDRQGLANGVLIPLLYTVAGYAPSPRSQAVVLDRAAQPQAAVSCTWPAWPTVAAGACGAATPAPADLGLTTLPVQKSIDGALAGAARSTLPLGYQGGGWIVVVPVRDPTGPVVGALVTIIYAPVRLQRPLTADGDSLAALGDFLRTFLTRVQPAGMVFLLLALVIGTLTGVWISRTLTRRLRQITRAADAWSRGEFAVAVPDATRDELGQLARDLNRMAAQIQALLATRQELAVVDERNRLARDLHDSVKQQVFAASMQVAAARALVRRDPDAAEAHLADVERMVGDAQRELTALILELRPVALANKGLAPALREYCDEWARRTGITVEVRVRGERSAPLDVEQVLFRVAQEALANVAKHSGATSAEVYLSWEPSVLLLSITDNGSGFDAIAADGKGVGLSSMRERIDAVGGALTIGGIARGSGTRIEACVPLVTPPALAAGSATKASDAARA